MVSLFSSILLYIAVNQISVGPSLLLDYITAVLLDSKATFFMFKQSHRRFIPGQIWICLWRKLAFIVFSESVMRSLGSVWTVPKEIWNSKQSGPHLGNLFICCCFVFFFNECVSNKRENELVSLPTSGTQRLWGKRGQTIRGCSISWL